jgi:opacity protein-like surface antigen
MKKIMSVLIVAAMAAGSALGGALDEGSRELGVQGSVDFESSQGTDARIALKLGQYVARGVQVGVSGSFADNDAETLWGGSVFGEYNLILDEQPVVPFVGLSLGFVRSEPDRFDDENALVFGVEAGGKYFLSENTAVTLSYIFSLASEDIYVNDNQLEDTEHGILLGLRFHL